MFYHYLGIIFLKVDLHYISFATRVEKEAELLTLEPGDMSVSGYEDKFISLFYFTDNMFQTEERKARMFEKGLWLQFQRFVVSQRLHTLREVVDSARVLELEDATTQRAREMTFKALAQAKEKGKGKRPFAPMGQERRNTWEFHRPRTCFNCGHLGHLARDCHRLGGGRGGGHSRHD